MYRTAFYAMNHFFFFSPFDFVRSIGIFIPPNKFFFRLGNPFELSEPMNTIHNSMCAMSLVAMHQQCIRRYMSNANAVDSARNAFHLLDLPLPSHSNGFDVKAYAFFFSDYLRDK